MRIDPIPIADDLIEVLLHGADPARIALLVAEAQDALPEVLAEVARRGALSRLLELGAGPLRERVLGHAPDVPALRVLADGLLEREGDDARAGLEQVVLRALDVGCLPRLFADLIDAGRYEPLRDRLAWDDRKDSPALRALAAARPTWDADALNAPTIERIRDERGLPHGCQTDLLVVPGFTPLEVTEPTPLSRIPAAVARVELARRDLAERRGAWVLTSGGSVHPPGTRHNEGLEMREYLIAVGVEPDRILVDPYARHSTTNLRNAGRLMHATRLRTALVVTGFERSVFDQAFYFANPRISTFAMRSRRELGYDVGKLHGLDEHHVHFEPADEVERPDYGDPLDV